MKKTIFTLLLVTLLMVALQAKPVDVQTAKSLGVKFIKANTEIKSATAELTYTAYADNGQAAFVPVTIPCALVVPNSAPTAEQWMSPSKESSLT